MNSADGARPAAADHERRRMPISADLVARAVQRDRLRGRHRGVSTDIKVLGTQPPGIVRQITFGDGFERGAGLFAQRHATWRSRPRGRAARRSSPSPGDGRGLKQITTAAATTPSPAWSQ